MCGRECREREREREGEREGGGGEGETERGREGGKGRKAGGTDLMEKREKECRRLQGKTQDWEVARK